MKQAEQALGVNDFHGKSAFDEIRKLETKSKKSKVVFITNQIFNIEKKGSKND